MKTISLKKGIKSRIENRISNLTSVVILFFLIWIAPNSSTSAQAILFDFDTAPLSTSLPISQTAGGITADLSATGQGYSIQVANVLGFVPAGFAGQIIYPNSIYLADLLVHFNQTLSDFSIMYTCNELGCDDAATMRVTAYMNGVFVGTNTRTATIPGTWPVDTLSCSFLQGFDSVVIHYDSPPPTCQDYGVIFMVDNMLVTPLSATSLSNPGNLVEGSIFPNPVSQTTFFNFYLNQASSIDCSIYDASGRLVKVLFEGRIAAGEHQLLWNVADAKIESGIYYLNIKESGYSKSFKIYVVKLQ